MPDEISQMAFQGRWDALLPRLRRAPSLINVASGTKGYTPLHQAAWHGAALPVVGEMLAMGADLCATTLNKGQTPCQIAREKHPDRQDLQFVLDDRPRTLAQMMRKTLHDHSDLFSAYDEGRAIFDRLVECFGADLCHPHSLTIADRLNGALQAVTGISIDGSARTVLSVPEGFHAPRDARFWQGTFLPLLQACCARSGTASLDPEWAVVADLFYPATDVPFGLRGDDFLWIEMAQALCHVPLPDHREDLARILTSAFEALTGEPVDRREFFVVRRFARGGMSSGGIDPSQWKDALIPLLLDRSDWLQAVQRRAE